ncbi:SWI/SNF-related matrix-associated actin-dependent regulator of chromatin subfamily A containing DEAD/H box 1-like isoform X2 [Tubulanus polymorphus]|uniref:SWI/SNF-related matrix-associated actin-dependent regulator of chromatin subfamily A containing DEAD/H box 1-like isoform X2 n=1 Tax=Tubulanus polymorphus TaxID=672921 RepID=UPI003DA370B0
MSSIQSLLRYRFVPKTSLKKDSSAEDAPSTSSSSGGTASNHANGTNHCNGTDEIDNRIQNGANSPNPSIETPPSQQPTSPILKTKSNVIGKSSNPIDDSDSDDNTTSKSSPWFSKGQRKLPRYRVKRKVADFSSDEDEKNDVKDDDSPAVHSSSSQNSEKISAPARKRARVILSDESDTEPVTTQESTESTLPQSTTDNSQSTEDSQLEFLMGAYPKLPKDKLKEVLTLCGNNVDKAVESLQKEEKDSLDISKAWSIKDLQATMKNRKAQNGFKSDDLNELAVKHKKSCQLSSSELRKNKTIEHFAGELPDDDEEYDSGDDDDSDQDEAENDSDLQKIIVDFFNESSVEECGALPNCSKKKAAAIIAARPYENYTDLKEKLNQVKILSHSIIEGAKQMIRHRNEVINLMKTCEKISNDIESAVSVLMNQTELNAGQDAEIVVQPNLINPKLTLKPYQMIGLNWLALMNRKELNGILADEMGLGKTIQAISFLAHLLEIGEKGPHLIIVPSSTLENWSRELHRWCPDLKVIMYYGSQEERIGIRQSIYEDNFETINVILTTYQMATGNVDDRVMFKKYEFHFGVLDEAHMLKNMVSLRYKNLMKIKIRRRLLLTGTPLQNNLVELMSLLAFVMPQMFRSMGDQLPKIFSMFSRGTTTNDQSRGNYERERIEHAKRIMHPFVLRRLKTQVLQQLPSKIEQILHCPMTAEQRQGYDDLVESVSKQYREKREGDVSQNTNHIVMQLRKWANHSLLQRTQYTREKLREMAKMLKRRDPGHYDANEDYILEDFEVMSDFEIHKTCKAYKCINKYCLTPDVICRSGKFEKFDELLPGLKENGDRVLIFSQFTMMMDIMEEYLNARGYKFCRLDGSTPVSERLKLIDDYNNDAEIFIFLLSTRAGGLGINLTSANTVILHDIDYNPYNDKQAEDRCHRVGQTREVTVIRIISKNSIEEGMLKCQESKLRLEQDITGRTEGDEDNSTDVASLLKDILAKCL